MPSQHFDDFAPVVVTPGPVPELVDRITAGDTPRIPPELVEAVASAVPQSVWSDYLRRCRATQ